MSDNGHYGHYVNCWLEILSKSSGTPVAGVCVGREKHAPFAARAIIKLRSGYWKMPGASL